MLPHHTIQPEGKGWITMGDINSHSPSWGYPDRDPKGDEMGDWVITNQMVLTNHPDEPQTYYSRARRTTSCPDIAIAADDVAKIIQCHVGGSFHKPVLLVIRQDLLLVDRRLCPSWNYKRPNWPEFRLKKKLTKTAETSRWSNITWMKKQTCSQEPSSGLPKKQFPEEEGKTASQARKLSYKISIVLSADSERRWNPAQQMITHLHTTKLKQNLPDSGFNRHALLGMKKPTSLNVEILTVRGSWQSC